MSKVVNISDLKKEFDKSLIKAVDDSGDVNSFKDLTKMKDKYLNMKRKTGASKLGALEEKLNKTGIGEKKKKFFQSSMKLGQKTLRGELTGNKLNISKSKGDAIEEYGKSFKDKYTKGNKYTKGKKFKYSDITFAIVFVYVIICLSIDEDHWFTISHDYSLYIFLGTFISFLTNNELGFPIKLMRKIMVEVLGKNNEYGFSYFLERIWLPLFRGLRTGTSVSAKVFSWPLSKMILYFPILIITLFQYIIPIAITIILIPITLVVGLIAGLFSGGGGAIVVSDTAEITDEGVAETDMFIASVLKKIWRTINKVIPFRKLLTVYIVGMTFYIILLPLLIDVYLTFAVFILTHIVLNKILIKGLLNNFPEKLQSYTLIRIIGYALIMGAYYYIQIQVNLGFLMLPHKDPISKILEIFSLEEYKPTFLNGDIKKNLKDLLCPPDPKSTYKDSTFPHLRVCINIFIFFIVIQLLNKLAKYVGKI